MRVFIFPSTRAVIKAEEAAREAGLQIRVIPVPRSISPHCGMALEVGHKDAPRLGELLAERGISSTEYPREELSLGSSEGVG